MLYLSKQARPDIQLSFSLLYTIVRDTFFDGYKKLTRLMTYVKGAIGLPLILSIEKSGNIKWYVDSAFAMHKDVRIHSCVFMTMGTGGAYFQSSKKNNTKSSTEAEIVGVNSAMDQEIWILYPCSFRKYKIQISWSILPLV